MAPKESFWGKERGRENGSLGGIFFSNGARGTTSPCHITGTTLTFPITHTRMPTCGELPVLEYELHVQYVTDCYARNVLYHSTHARHQGLVSFFKC